MGEPFCFHSKKSKLIWVICHCEFTFYVFISNTLTITQYQSNIIQTHVARCNIELVRRC